MSGSLRPPFTQEISHSAYDKQKYAAHISWFVKRCVTDFLLLRAASTQLSGSLRPPCAENNLPPLMTNELMVLRTTNSLVKRYVR